MSSGYGAFGGQGRCFLFWKEYENCLIQARENGNDCSLFREDYLECLHHRKEVSIRLMLFYFAYIWEMMDDFYHYSNSRGTHL